MQSSHSVKPLSRGLLVGAAIALAASLFVPIWRIELDAPQYPEGLALQIWASKLGGDVDIINGLNHYIGMQTLHTENFIEFTLLPYLIAAFALIFLVTALWGNRKALLGSFISFLLFGVVSMIDFYRWNYNYGHNLDPNAAIQVPGMAYQPPLIGFKQLLNFGAFSIPDTGGWLFIGAGILVTLAVVNTFKISLGGKKSTALVVLPLLLLQNACTTKGPVPITINVDQCEYCIMTITDAKFSCQLVTDKGRVYKFDDLACLKRYQKDYTAINATAYVADYHTPKNFMLLTAAFLVKGDAVKSPMGGQTAAFAQQQDALNAKQQWQAELVTW